jgi:hypothetical protein
MGSVISYSSLPNRIAGTWARFRKGSVSLVGRLSRRAAAHVVAITECGWVESPRFVAIPPGTRLVDHPTKIRRIGVYRKHRRTLRRSNFAEKAPLAPGEAVRQGLKQRPRPAAAISDAHAIPSPCL